MPRKELCCFIINFQINLHTVDISLDPLQLIIKDIEINLCRTIRKVNLKFDEEIQKPSLKSKNEESSPVEGSSFILKRAKKVIPDL